MDQWYVTDPPPLYLNTRMYQSTKLENKLTVSISASFERIDTVCNDVKQFMVEKKLNDMIFDVILGIREVLTNAVQHGSNMDPHQEVQFYMEVDEDKIRFRICDSGIGFDWREKEKKQAFTTDTCGRGISILKEYFDSYHYNESGNQIELEKKRS